MFLLPEEILLNLSSRNIVQEFRGAAYVSFVLLVLFGSYTSISLFTHSKYFLEKYGEDIFLLFLVLELYKSECGVESVKIRNSSGWSVFS